MRVSLFLLLCLFPVFLIAQAETEKKIISQMLTACDEIQGARYLMSMTERKKNGSTDGKDLLVKIKTHPKKIYTYSIKPNPGAEAMWRSGEMNNHVLVNPNGFPFVNLKLDPYNSILRKDGHHTIKELGFDYIPSMVIHYKNTLGDKFYSYLNIDDTIQWDGRKLIRLVFDYPEFSYQPYTVKPGENVSTIGLLHYVNDYMIVCANEKIDDFGDVKANQKIVIPNCFARKVVFGIDLITKLPLLQEVYDEKGLFEKYELKSFILNPKFEPDEFTPGFKDYHF